MNRTQINEWRVAHGLDPLVVDTQAQAARKRAQRANRAAHNALQAAIRDARNRNRKG